MTDGYANWSARGRAPADDEADLREALERGDRPQRRDAALALVDVASDGLADETVDALAAAARTADDPKTRQFAVETLGVAGAGRETVLGALDDADEWVRAEAVVALSRVDPGATGALRAALDDESGPVRRNAVIALGKTGEADDDLLVECLKRDPDAGVREYTAQYLRGAADTERAVRILAAVLARDPGPFVRAKAAESLGDFGTERAERALETQGLGDRSEDVRRTAERALARSRGVDRSALDVRADAPDRARPPGGDASPGPAGSDPNAVPTDVRPGPDPRPVGYGDAEPTGSDDRSRPTEPDDESTGTDRERDRRTDRT